MPKNFTGESGDVRCSFCNKGQMEDNIKKMFKAQAVGSEDAVSICDECVVMCHEMLQRAERNEAERQQQQHARRRPLPKPQELHAELDRHVIGQDQSKKVLSVAIYNHYKRVFKASEMPVSVSKSNILLLGPTGSGKTLLAQTIARILDVPMAVADATTLTEAGYVGEDVESIIHRLLMKCDYDVSRAECGIIYVDEVDKITRKGAHVSITRDVSGEGVQQALLKLVEGTYAMVPPEGGRKHPGQELIPVNTSNILFIFGGAFVGLERIIADRVGLRSGMGFQADIRDASENPETRDLLRQLEPGDLVRYGLIPEFVGRLPVLGTLEELTESDLVQILTKPQESLVRQFQELFRMDGAELHFTRGALRELARQAIRLNTGARGLRQAVESHLLEPMYRLPSETGVTRVLFNAESIRNHAPPVFVRAASEAA
ncbi:MAG: ATP-dependent Clp protease ATP-binding subunit ClpX [Gammaproteobacteria bacterium AqS3]|nr:ATP-dependent Clp protease ATP-binding subunit ClpX [Gammaproteobacteria bacterium AqS3]